MKLAKIENFVLNMFVNIDFSERKYTLLLR